MMNLLLLLLVFSPVTYTMEEDVSTEKQDWLLKRKDGEHYFFQEAVLIEISDELKQAVNNEDFEVIKKWGIDHKTDPAYWAIKWGTSDFSRQCINFLQKKNYNFDMPRDNRDTNLHWFVEYGKTDNVKLLLGAGASVTVKNAWGRTPLHVAAAYYKTKKVKLLIDAGADVNERDNNGDTPLHLALKRLRTESRHKFISYLISCKADCSMKNNNQKSAIDLSEELPDNLAETKALFETFECC